MNRERFGQQMGRLYAARGADFDEGQATVYYERLGRLIPVPGAAPGTVEPLFTEQEIVHAFNRALDEIDTRYGICSLAELQKFAWEARRKYRPGADQRYLDREKPSPEEVDRFRALWREALGARPADPPPPHFREPGGIPDPASDETWSTVQREVNKILGSEVLPQPRRRA